MSAEEAEGYHARQVATFAAEGVDIVSAITMTYPEEAIGVVRAAVAAARRIRGIRADASTLSHAELDEAEELDDGDPDDLAARYSELRRTLREVNVVGGCCGTDHRHVGAVCRATVAAGPAAG